MGQPHHYAHSHAAEHHSRSDTRLVAAVCVNGALTVVQVIGGLLSGSLSLLADALHNLIDDPERAMEITAWRGHLIAQLGNRPEGFTDGERLIKQDGPTTPVLRDVIAQAESIENGK